MTLIAQTSNSHGDFTAIVIENGDEIGTYWRNPYGYFASPRNSEIQHVPCESEEDCLATIERHGTMLPGQAHLRTLLDS